MKRRTINTGKFVLLTALFTAAAIVFSSIFGLGPGAPAYSITNARADGAGLIYDTLKGMGFDIYAAYAPIGADFDIQAIQIVLEPEPAYTQDHTGPLDWVYRGGRLIWLSDTYDMPLDGLVPVEFMNGLVLFKYGLGNILLGPADVLSNAALLNDRAYGRMLAQLLTVWNGEHIYFNEYYHGFSHEPGLFGSLPGPVRLCAFQLILAAIAVIWYLGKGFGKPSPYYEETELMENAYITALANIYEKTGNGYAAFSAYLNRLINLKTGGYGLKKAEILSIWSDNGLPYEDELKKLLEYTEKDFNTKKPAGRRNLIKASERLDRLAAGLKGDKLLWKKDIHKV